jgi:hypothetical protein
MSSLDQFRIISVSHINGKLWNIFYELDDGSTDFETVKALDNQEAYHAAVKIITKKLSQK